MKRWLPAALLIVVGWGLAGCGGPSSVDHMPSRVGEQQCAGESGTGGLAAAGECASEPAAVGVAVAAIQAGPEFNATDVMFLQMLIYHQKQGLTMATTAASRARGAELKVLAAAVRAIEQDELTMMQSWLEQWRQPTAVGTDRDLHADHGGLPATGPAEIKALRATPAPEFDAAFLNLFVAHQHNAVELAHLETTDGRNRVVTGFADRVRVSRQREIQQMLTLLTD